MAKKKKEDEFKYLNAYIPKGQSYSKRKKLEWYSFNKRQTNDTGAISAECNVCTHEAPYFTPARAWEPRLKVEGEDGSLVPCAISENGVNIDEVNIQDENKERGIEGKYTFYSWDNGGYYLNIDKKNDIYNKENIISNLKVTFYDKKSTPSSYHKLANIYFLEIFNVIRFSNGFIYFIRTKCVTNSSSPSSYKSFSIFIENRERDFSKLFISMKYVSGLEGEYGEFDYPIIFSTTKTLDGNISNTVTNDNILCGLNIESSRGRNKSSIKLKFDIEYERYDISNTHIDVVAYLGDEFPTIKYPCSFQSRLFGVNNNAVFASGFNDYSNWAMDVEETNADNAWMSSTQSNPKASGSFTAIVSYGGHVLCFRDNFMQEIYNTKNPFRVIDIGEYGCISQRSFCEVNGVLYFAAYNGIFAYNGSNVKSIGYNIKADDITKAVFGRDGNVLLAYIEQKGGEKHFYTYDTSIDMWSERSNVLGACEAFGGVSKEFVPKTFVENEDTVVMLTEEGEAYTLSEDNYNLDWSFETDFMTAQTVDIKHVRKLQLLADVADGANFKVFVQYDSYPVIHELYSSDGKTGTLTVRVKPRLTAHYGFKLIFKGHGYVKLYGMELHITGGGELFKT